MPSRRLWWVAALALGLAPAAEAGVVRGILRPPATFSRPTVARNPYPGTVHALPGVDPVASGRVTDAVISIERIPAAVDSAIARPGAAPRLAQRNQVFVPHVLPVAAGATVEFPNLDPIFHNVFSVSPGKRFDLGKYPRGQSRRVRFDRPGLIQVYCDIHSNMAAFIVVLPNHAFAQPDGAGRFALPDLPAGEYVVNIWHPDFPAVRRPVRVPELGDLDLDLSLGPAAGPRAGVTDSPEAPETR
jgi:plastocyanin